MGMEEYRVTGGRPLSGMVTLPGAKNSVLPIMAAALLCGEPVKLLGVPRLSDVETAMALHQAVGAVCGWEENVLTIAPGEEQQAQLPRELACAMRGSVFYLAPLLAGAGRVTLPLPGGCRLGPRKIDLHLEGLLRMGARLRWHGDWMTLERSGRLHGIDHTLRLPSVGATEALLMAAVTAKGTTILRGVACEPEIQDLADFLTACGARIEGAGGPIIRVMGVEALHGCTWRPISDRIVACTYGAAAAIAGGEVKIRHCQGRHLRPFLTFLSGLGCTVEQRGDTLVVGRQGPLTGDTRLTATGYPGFATDALPLAAAVCLYSRGTALLADTLFENRFACARGFARMGASLSCGPRGLLIQGGAPLTGAEVTAPDLRGGAALLLAALGAEGTTVLRDPGYLRRGYWEIERVLSGLGGEVEVRSVE